MDPQKKKSFPILLVLLIFSLLINILFIAVFYRNIQNKIGSLFSSRPSQQVTPSPQIQPTTSNNSAVQQTVPQQQIPTVGVTSNPQNLQKTLQQQPASNTGVTPPSQALPTAPQMPQ